MIGLCWFCGPASWEATSLDPADRRGVLSVILGIALRVSLDQLADEPPRMGASRAMQAFVGNYRAVIDYSKARAFLDQFVMRPALRGGAERGGAR